MATKRHRSAGEPRPPPQPGQPPRQTLTIHPEIARAGSAAALDVLRSVPRPPPLDIFVERGGHVSWVPSGQAPPKLAAGVPVSLHTHVEESTVTDPSAISALTAGTPPPVQHLRHYQQLEVWPFDARGVHPMRLTRHEYAAPPCLPTSPPYLPTSRPHLPLHAPYTSPYISPISARYAAPPPSTPDAAPPPPESTRSVAINFYMHGQARNTSLTLTLTLTLTPTSTPNPNPNQHQARTSAFVRQWEAMLSPEASARRLGGATATTAGSPRPPGAS